MTQQDYEQKKRECWEEYLAFNDEKYSKSAFSYAFDRAYALGKQTETITREEIEMAAKEFAERECEIGQVDRDALYKGYYHGMKDSLGKQEKDAEEQKVFTCEKSKVLYRFRMAEACKIGNSPEGDYWIGYSKAIQDLFGLEGEPYVTPNDAGTVISGWVAIDEAYAECFLHTEKPIQKAQPIADTGDYDTVWDSKGKTYLLDAGLFPDMDSDSDPIEVELIIKRKKNE